jgi:lysozyme family protein
MTDDDIIDGILEREGGYVNRPEDRGGATRFGVTRRTLSSWRGRVCSAEDVAALTPEEARQILRRLYLERPGLQAVTNGPLRALLVDCAVNHGPEDAVRWLQRALGMTSTDGILGPRTREALAGADARRLYLLVCAQRIRRYGDLITRRPTQAIFASGWMNRAAEFVETAP